MERQKVLVGSTNKVLTFTPRNAFGDGTEGFVRVSGQTVGGYIAPDYSLPLTADPRMRFHAWRSGKNAKLVA